MRNRIWTELTQSKHNIEFSSLYSEHQRFLLRAFNMTVLIFSSTGVMGWKFWDNLPLVACIIIASISLLKLLQPHLIMNEKQLKNLDDIHRFYSDYYNKIEKLWYDFESDRITEEEATNIFFTLKSLETEINPIVSETIKSKPKKIIQKCKRNSDEYFEQVFNT